MPAKESEQEKVPSPEELLNDALEETEDPLAALTPYAETILLLRKRGLSWEKIENFLNSRGIEATCQEIYYVARRETNHRRAKSFKYPDDDLPIPEEQAD